MERLNKFGVMPLRGETMENVLQHQAVFGLAFGAVGDVKQFMGDRYRPAENAGVICIEFRTGNVSETDVGYRHVMSEMARLMSGKLGMYIADHPWAHAGDDGNIVEGESSCMTFVSSDGKDPRGATTKYGYVRALTGWRMSEIAVPARPDGGLRPETTYWLTFRRLDRVEGSLPALNILYHGTDDPEHGGEQRIFYGTFPELPDVLDEATGAVPMFSPLTGLPGIFIPDSN